MSVMDPQQAAEEQVEPHPALDGTQAMMEALNAIEQCCVKAAGEQSSAEAKDWMQAALFGAQVLTSLDPSRLAGGDTPEGRAASMPVQPQATKDGDHDGIVGA